MAHCNFCRANFENRQAVRAHLKGCAAYKAHRERDGSAAEPKGKMPLGTVPDLGTVPSRQSTMPQAMPQARSHAASEATPIVPPQGSRLDHEAVEIVLRANEALRSLRQDLVESLPIRQLFNPVAVQKGQPSYAEWYDLAQDLVSIEQTLDRIVTQARVSREDPWTLYKLALAVRDRWVSWRRAEARSYWQREGEALGKTLDDVLDEFGVPDLEQRLTRVIEGLRWLTSHTRATR